MILSTQLLLRVPTQSMSRVFRLHLIHKKIWVEYVRPHSIYILYLRQEGHNGGPSVPADNVNGYLVHIHPCTHMAASSHAQPHHERTSQQKRNVRR